ncbi:serine/threonine protein kinase [Achromatium sp. WMS2]|nr:serine/threonine protein kinase [Achromatium sp. WMS2]
MSNTAGTAPTRHYLPPGSVLDCYRVEEKIGSGGFSLIYLAVDEDGGGEVVIKEFMPKKFARRDESFRVIPIDEQAQDSLNRGKALFFQEVAALSALRHPNVVAIRGFFLANRTAYMVMEYYRGKNLAAFIKQRKGDLSTSFILRVFLPILDAVNMIHTRQYLHLDIKPNNIYLCTAGNEPILLDFGAVHQLKDGNQRRGSQVITAGYSPIEQYYQSGTIGPWSDVYAIGASIRACMEARAPMTSLDRVKITDPAKAMKPITEVLKDRYPEYLLECIDWAMEMDPQARPKDAGELLAAIQSKRGRPKDKPVGSKYSPT